MGSHTDEQRNLQALPELCYSVLPSDDSVIIIKRGEQGYYPTDYPEGSDKFVDEFNARMGVTKAQRLAMEIGSMMGWSVPGANPAVHEARLANA